MDAERPRLLVVDDDRSITASLRRALQVEGYAVDIAATGETGLERILGERWDLVILDVALPGISGLDVCRRVRSRTDAAILMLTARDETADRVAGLDTGADDYLVKPFALEELLARIRALLRRPRPDSSEGRSFADLRLDPATRDVWRGDRRLDLSAREFALLEFFLTNPRQVLSRELLLDRVWGFDGFGESNVADVYIGYLRAKLEAGGEPRLIHTVRGAGYVLREP